MTKENVCVKITNEKDRLELLKVLVDNGQEIGVLTKKGLQTGEDSLGNDQMIYPYIGYVPCENGFSGRSTIYPNRNLVSISELENILKQNDMTQNEKLKQSISELEELKVKIEGLIKPEFVVGKWYNYNKSTLNYQGFNENGIIQAFGSIRGEWTDICNCGERYNQWKEATHEEVEKMLIDEAKKRGLVEGAYIKSDWLSNDSLFSLGNGYKFDGFELINSGDICDYTLFRSGEWATVVDTKKSQLNDDIEAMKKKYPEYNINVFVEGK